MRKIISKNPLTGELRQTFDFVTNEELKAKIDKSAKAFQIHSNKPFEERQKSIKNLGVIIERRFKEITEMITF